MTWTVDTGVTQPDAASGWRMGAAAKRDAILNGVGDALPVGHTLEQADAAVVAHILGDLYTPKMLKTVRAHLLMYWPLLANMADRSPVLVDEVLMAYAELTTVLPESAAGRSPANRRTATSKES